MSEHRRILVLDESRRTINLGLRPSLQLRLPIIVLVISVGFAGLFAVHSHTAYARFLSGAIRQAQIEPLVAEQTIDFLIVSGVIAVAYIAAVMIACLAHSHRLLGPIVAFRRHIEALKNGDYGARVQLRKGDPFTDVADDMNDLTTILRTNEKANRRPS